jgi:hypothetical protein
MSEMFVWRRADGELFTERIDGKWIVPLWSARTHWLDTRNATLNY